MRQFYADAVVRLVPAQRNLASKLTPFSRTVKGLAAPWMLLAGYGKW